MSSCAADAGMTCLECVRFVGSCQIASCLAPRLRLGPRMRRERWPAGPRKSRRRPARHPRFPRGVDLGSKRADASIGRQQRRDHRAVRGARSGEDNLKRACPVGRSRGIVGRARHTGIRASVCGEYPWARTGRRSAPAGLPSQMIRPLASSAPAARASSFLKSSGSLTRPSSVQS